MPREDISQGNMQDAGRDPSMAIEVVSVRDSDMVPEREEYSAPVQQELAEPIRQKSSGLSAESREDKARRLQWLLQQLIRETLRENNEELCQSMKESLIKELDYQFRSQEEREEERDRLAQQRSEEYYRKMDELLCKKSRRKADKADKKERAAEKVKPDGTHRAVTGTGTTGNAGIGIDHCNTGIHADCAYRTRTGTSTAAYTSVAYYKCHTLILPNDRIDF